MTEENKAILDRNRHFHITLTGPAQMLRGLNQHEKNDLLKAAREEFFGPNYSPDMFCPPCIADMIVSVYRQYDKWLSEQVIPENIPIVVKANFPSNKKRK